MRRFDMSASPSAAMSMTASHRACARGRPGNGEVQGRGALDGRYASAPMRQAANFPSDEATHMATPPAARRQAPAAQAPATLNTSVNVSSRVGPGVRRQVNRPASESWYCAGNTPTGIASNDDPGDSGQ